MAYYLQSLAKVIERILCPDQRKFFDHEMIQQIESLLEKACSMRNSLENSGQDRINSFEDKIRCIAQKAEDVLEKYVTDHLSEVVVTWTIDAPNLQSLLEDFDSAKVEMTEILDGGTLGRISSSTSPAVPSRSDPNPKKIVVGFTEDLIQLKNRVLGDSTKVEIIPIAGMGGIGKTTLARSIYDDSSVVPHFDARAWTTISDDYSMQGILLALLSCITEKHIDDMIEETDNMLTVTLHKKLMGKRYLIVLDDIWHSKAWDDVKKFFPNERNGSRIILTTRESGVATYVDSKSPHHKVHPLNGDQSWKLLREKVFGDGTCPLEYEELRLKIAKDCGGLPLAIHVIGGLLSHTERTKESWAQVADNVSTAIADKDEQFSRILSLSYDHLPHYLKPCFLYMSAFPEDYEISASKLVRLWVAEGFINPLEGRSLEEAAEAYLEGLVQRNLLFVRHWQKINGKVKSCVMHDLVRDLCVTKAREKMFLHVMNRPTLNPPEKEDRLNHHRMSVHTLHCNEDFYGSIERMPNVRSLIFVSRGSLKSSSSFPGSRLLRVLDVLIIDFFQFPEVIPKLVNLRYLAFSSSDELNPRITTLTNLQTLIVRFRGYVKVTPEIFNMPSLRVVEFFKGKRKAVWCDVKDYWRNLVLQVNLQSLSTIEISNLDEVVKKIPNLKKLGICCSRRSYSKNVVIDLTCLRQLETLKFITEWGQDKRIFSTNISFPDSLKKLSLSSCKLLQVCMKKIGMLPNLEILKMKNVIFEDNKWEPSEGEFCRLQFLQLERLKLVDWPVDETNFPSLRHLVIHSCRELKEIHTGIGDISTLKTIMVFASSTPISRSAMNIRREQHEYGNDILQVHVQGSPLEKRRFMMTYAW